MLLICGKLQVFLLECMMSLHLLTLHREDGVPDPLKSISLFYVIQMGSLLQLEVEGSGFLYRQVRNMVALLIHIGKEALDSDIVPMILESGNKRQEGACKVYYFACAASWSLSCVC